MNTTPFFRQIFAAVFCLGLALALPASDACAQRGGEDRRGGRDRDDENNDRRRRGRENDNNDDDRRRRGRGDEDRRGDDRRGQERRGQSDQDRQAWFVRRLDRNGDGRIERSEVDSDRMWSFFERSAKEAGIDPGSGVTVDKFLKARQVHQRQELRSENPTAFLAPLEPELAPGFDTPLTGAELILLNPDKERPFETVSTTSTSTEDNERRSPWSRSRRGSDDSSSESSNDRTQRYANSLMERYDKNNNSILEKDEWQEMRGDPERSDLNKDGKITKDELIKRFSSFSRGGDDDDRQERRGGDERSSRSRRSSRDDERGSRNDEDDEATRNTYRFTTALERLPRDARSWVERYDDNNDGQVAMAEFSSSWSESKVREFTEFDLDGDGIVTGSEYLKSKER